jgi:hypothetical protein
MIPFDGIICGLLEVQGAGGYSRSDCSARGDACVIYAWSRQRGSIQPSLRPPSSLSWFVHMVLVESMIVVGVVYDIASVRAVFLCFPCCVGFCSMLWCIFFNPIIQNGPNRLLPSDQDMEGVVLVPEV